MGKEEARRQGSAKARGGRARRTRWARREAHGSGVPITAIVHVVRPPSHLTRGALVRPVDAARAALARANLARANLARANLAGLAPPRRPARRHAALRLGEVATRPTHAVMVPILPRLRASGAELRAARRRIALAAPPFAAVAVVPARPLVRRRRRRQRGRRSWRRIRRVGRQRRRRRGAFGNRGGEAGKLEVAAVGYVTCDREGHLRTWWGRR